MEIKVPSAATLISTRRLSSTLPAINITTRQRNWHVRRKGVGSDARRKGPVQRVLLCTLKEPIGAWTRAGDTRRPDCLNYGWPASLSGADALARRGSQARWSHTTDNSRSSGLDGPGGVERREGLCRVGQQGMSVGRGWCGSNDRAGREARKAEEPHVPWEIFENDCPECHSRLAPDEQQREGECPPQFSAAELLRNVTYELALSTWRHRVEHTELLTRAPPLQVQIVLPGDIFARVMPLDAGAALLNVKSKHASVNLRNPRRSCRKLREEIHMK